MPRGLDPWSGLGPFRCLPTNSRPFAAIRYVQEDGGGRRGTVPGGGGLGVRRIALWRAVQQAERGQGPSVERAIAECAACRRPRDTDAGPHLSSPDRRRRRLNSACAAPPDSSARARPSRSMRALPLPLEDLSRCTGLRARSLRDSGRAGCVTWRSSLAEDALPIKPRSRLCSIASPRSRTVVRGARSSRIARADFSRP